MTKAEARKVERSILKEFPLGTPATRIGVCGVVQRAADNDWVIECRDSENGRYIYVTSKEEWEQYETGEKDAKG